MIKTIIFDIGGVLIQEERKQQYQELAKEYHYDIDQFYNTRIKYITLCAEGKISGQEYIFSIGKALGIQDVNTYYKRWLFYCEKNSSVNTEVKAIIEELKGKYLLVTLSNIIEPHNIIREKLHAYEDFDKIFLSFERGYKKPDKNFYELLLQELNIPAEEIAFIDDSKTYVDVAKKLGMKGLCPEMNRFVYWQNNYFSYDTKNLTLPV